MQDANYILVQDGYMGSTDGYTSVGWSVARMEHVSITAAYTGTPSGTLVLQASNDRGDKNSANWFAGPDVGNWVTIANSSVTVTTADTTVWNLSNTGHRWLRVKYTWTASTGTLNVTANAKG